MKKFYNEKELSKYLDVNEQYLHEEINDFLNCQGSEIFTNEEDITIDNFKYEGVDVDGTIIYIAGLQHEEYFKYIYCIE